jgi:hypothetical protein
MGSFYQPKSYFKGGASYYQSKNYFKGGKRKTAKKGGFYPSVMSGVLGSGKYLFPAVLHQGCKLLNNNNSKTRKSKKSKSLRKKHK